MTHTVKYISTNRHAAYYAVDDRVTVTLATNPKTGKDYATCFTCGVMKPDHCVHTKAVRQFRDRIAPF